MPKIFGISVAVVEFGIFKQRETKKSEVFGFLFFLLFTDINIIILNIFYFL